MSIIRSIANGIGTVVGFFFEEPRVARYVAVAESAGGLTIPDAANPQSDRHLQNIHAPGLLNGSFPVIFFRTRHTGRPAFSVRLNAVRLTQHTFADVGPNSWHEIVPAGALKPQDNELTLNVTGAGAVTFSDVVILYTSDKLTVTRPPVLDRT